MNQTEERY